MVLYYHTKLAWVHFLHCLSLLYQQQYSGVMALYIALLFALLFRKVLVGTVNGDTIAAAMHLHCNGTAAPLPSKV